MKMPYPILHCEICNNPFAVRPYRAKTARFCSFKCRQINSGRKGGAVTGAKKFRTGTKGYVKVSGRHQHRVEAEAMLGRKLLQGEIVHHKDGDKHNNSHSNLEVMTQSQHAKLHWPEMHKARKEKNGRQTISS